jgi:hypothetical protein
VTRDRPRPGRSLAEAAEPAIDGHRAPDLIDPARASAIARRSERRQVARHRVVHDTRPVELSRWSVWRIKRGDVAARAQAREGEDRAIVMYQ